MKLDLNRDFYEQLFDQIYDGMYIVDRDRKICHWNHAAEKITGYTQEEVLGRQCSDSLLMHLSTRGQRLCKTGGCPLEVVSENKSAFETDIFFRHKQGQRVPVTTRTFPVFHRDGELCCVCQVFRDNSAIIREKRRIEELRKASMLDELTKVGNRRCAEDKLLTALEECRRYHRMFGVLFVDIDGFKKVNDQHGHKVGDQVLTMVARTMKRSIRSFDSVCRWGGEEFVVLILNVDKEQLAAVAEKLRILVKNSGFTVETGSINVTVSVGGTISREGDKKEDLIQRADQLMYKCKKAGKDRTMVET